MSDQLPSTQFMKALLGDTFMVETGQARVVCHECGVAQQQPRDPFCTSCDADLRPLRYEPAHVEGGSHSDTRDATAE